ncbi:hypothetical protein DFH11DRAFT_1573120 [Phellopilus nigrolimitatus]|nr:hypothetical protein DFH11DRAFT_1573120 [Phellopilus nigrolimitatus]
MPLNPSRLRALALYKELHRLGRDYPDPSKMYERNRNLEAPEDVEKALQFGEYIRNETLALIKLSKYRHLKRVYPPLEGPPDKASPA